MSSQTKCGVIQGSTDFKESGVDWLGQVPSHWQVNRLKYSIESVVPGIWGSDPQGDTSDITVVRVADFDRPHLRVGNEVLTVRSIRTSERQARLLAPGDLLIEKSGGTAANPVGFVAMYEGPAETSVYANFIARMRPAQGQVPRYWLYAHAASYVTRLTARSVKQTTGIQNLDQRSYFDELFPFPPASEQQEIADYLDRETQRIDGLIAEQRGLIETLRERRDAGWASLYEGAASNGYSVQVRRALESIVDGPFGSSLTSAHYSEEGARVIRLGNIGVNQFRNEDKAFVPLEYAAKLSYHEARDGDVIIAGLGDERWPLGRATVLPEIGPAIVKADCYRARPNGLVTADYLAWVLSAPASRRQIALLARGATRARLNTSVVRDVTIPVPSVEEQVKIVQKGQVETSRIDALIAESEDLITLSQERRAALITAAVTGQIDVRTAV